MNKYSTGFISRVVDILLSISLIILFSPILIVICLLILLDGTKGPILIKSPYRVKMGGKIFRMYKFRSMVPNAHEKMERGDYGSSIFNKWRIGGGKLSDKEDPRITWIGRIIRSFDIDELPQLFNVFVGDMSIVGPRPYIEDEIPRYKKQFPKLVKEFDLILSVKPGITGLWQVSGRNSLPLKDRIMLDSECARRKSFLYDMLILVRTPHVVITRKGVI